MNSEFENNQNLPESPETEQGYAPQEPAQPQHQEPEQTYTAPQDGAYRYAGSSIPNGNYGAPAGGYGAGSGYSAPQSGGPSGPQGYQPQTGYGAQPPSIPPGETPWPPTMWSRPRSRKSPAA